MKISGNACVCGIEENRIRGKSISINLYGRIWDTLVLENLTAEA